MPRYKVCVVKTTTTYEHAYVVVEASSPVKAVDVAFNQIEMGEIDPRWEFGSADDGELCWSNSYATKIEEKGK